MKKNKLVVVGMAALALLMFGRANVSAQDFLKKYTWGMTVEQVKKITPRLDRGQLIEPGEWVVTWSAFLALNGNVNVSRETFFEAEEEDGELSRYSAEGYNYIFFDGKLIGIEYGRGTGQGSFSDLTAKYGKPALYGNPDIRGYAAWNKEPQHIVVYGGPNSLTSYIDTTWFNGVCQKVLK
jgi:hypothetical protein